MVMLKPFLACRVLMVILPRCLRPLLRPSILCSLLSSTSLRFLLMFALVSIIAIISSSPASIAPLSSLMLALTLVMLLRIWPPLRPLRPSLSPLLTLPLPVPNIEDQSQCAHWRATFDTRTDWRFCMFIEFDDTLAWFIPLSVTNYI